METISLSGSWALRALGDNTASYFSDNSTLEYNNTNSVFTALRSVMSTDEARKQRGKLFSIERTFRVKLEEGERAVLLKGGAEKAYINGKAVEKNEITDLLHDGDNTVRLTVNSSFFGDVKILKSRDGVGYGAHLRPVLDNGIWQVNAEMDYEAFRDHERNVRLTILGHTAEKQILFEKGRRKYHIALSISDSEVERWSIHGDGPQIVYQALLKVGEAELERRIAFRTIEEKNGALYVNGRETFVMGATWPVELTSDQSRYDMMLSSATWANMNALLIEEGHESHAFYNTCDRLGLIVLHNEEKDESYTFHPSYVTGKLNVDIFKAEVHDDGYYGSCLDAIALERWTLRTRSDNSNHGVIYKSLLSTVKEDGKWRPSHYAARRFFSDLVPIMFIENDRLNIYVSNDGPEDEDVELSVKFMTYSGQKRTKRMFEASVPKHQAVKVQEIDLRNIDRAKEFVYIKLRTFSIHRELTLLLDEIAKCEYEKADFEIKTRKINSRSYSIRLISNKPAFAVHLELEGISGNFSDSFFEVRPSGEKSVIFNSLEEIDEEEIMKRLRIYDLASSIKG